MLVATEPLLTYLGKCFPLTDVRFVPGFHHSVCNRVIKIDISVMLVYEQEMVAGAKGLYMILRVLAHLGLRSWPSK